MAEWTQKGFAVVADSNVGPPLTLGFWPAKWEAEHHLKRNQDVPDMTGTVMEKVIASLRVVEAELRFDDGKPE